MAKINLTGYEQPLEYYRQWELAALCEKYMVNGRTGGFRKVKKSILIQWLKEDKDYISNNPKIDPAKAPRRAAERDNRIKAILEKIYKGTFNSREIMEDVISVLTPSGYPPMAGGYYTYIYYAKTKKIYYDQHPLVTIDSVNGDHFYAYNIHWPQMRHYVQECISGSLYKINKKEYDTLRKLSYKKIVYNE